MYICIHIFTFMIKPFRTNYRTLIKIWMPVFAENARFRHNCPSIVQHWLEFEILIYCHCICHTEARSCLGIWNWLRKPEYPPKTPAQLQVTGNFIIFPGVDSNPERGERQLSVSFPSRDSNLGNMENQGTFRGNALPVWKGSCMKKLWHESSFSWVKNLFKK